ncbi:MAG: hypothetical protein KDB07_06925, partial [Planctomycetes bacterium]|nr:hypothetical protein [Planctomycetota bacterium]
IGQAQIQEIGVVLVDDPTDPDATNTEFPLGEIGSHFTIQDGDIDDNPYPNDLVALQIALAKRKCLYRFCQRMVRANSPSAANREFAGFGDIIEANMIVTATTPGTFVWAELIEAISLVSNGSGMPTCVMGSRVAIREVMEAIGPTDMPWTTVQSAAGEYRVPSIFGAPLLRNDMLNDAEDASKLWVLSLGDAGEQGTERGVTAIVPPNASGDPFRIRATPVPGGSVSVDVTLPIGLAAGSQGALALYDYTTV